MSLINYSQNSLIGVLMFFYSASVYSQTCFEDEPKSTPDAHFDVSDDGEEVTHRKTGLIWQRCSVGQKWNGSSCAESAGTYNWGAALTLTGSMWRLPNIKELTSIVETACSDPAVNKNIFPGTPAEETPLYYLKADTLYWTSSPSANSFAAAWQVNFSAGTSSEYPKGIERYVRLVRGGQ